MNNVNKTMYIPLYGKAYVSKKGILLQDPKAEEIWVAEEFPLGGKSKSKYLAYYMAMRSAVMDGWLRDKMQENPQAVVLHLGCGMDSRVERVGFQGHMWYDVDFPQVIEERKKYYQESDCYHMIASDVQETKWLQQTPEHETAIVVMEGISMYLVPEALAAVLKSVSKHFSQVSLLMDCYTTFAAKASKYKNPVKEVGVSQVYGLDDPKDLEQGTAMQYVKAHPMTPDHMIDQLTGMEKALFHKLYAGSMSQKLYRMYEYISK